MKRLLNIRLLFAMMAIILALNFSTQVWAQGNGYVQVQSKKSFEETVSSLRKMVAKNQMMVLAEINHGKILSMTGLTFNGMSLFIGNPTIGKKLFSADQGVGVAVPIRVNIYEAADGHTYINYVKPSAQLAPFSNPKVGMIAKKLDEKLAKLTGMLSR